MGSICLPRLPSCWPRPLPCLMRCLLRRLPLIFWDSSRGLALASFGLSPAAVVPWGIWWLLQGPDCFQPYLGKLAALMAAMMGAATCLAALLAAKRLAAIPGRLVSACLTGLRWKLLAGKAKEKLLSGWVPCSPWIRVMLQIPQVGRCRATESVATESSVPVFLCANKEGTITAAHVTDLSKDYITACLPEPMSLDDLRSRQQLRDASVAAARKGTPRFLPSPVFQLFLKKDQKTKKLMVELGMKLRLAVAAHVSGDQFLATIGGRLLGLDKTVAELGLLSGGTLQVVERLRGGRGFSSGKGGFGRPMRDEYVPIPGEWQCNVCHATRCWGTRNTCYRCGYPRERIVLSWKLLALVSRWVLWVEWLLPGALLSILRTG